MIKKCISKEWNFSGNGVSKKVDLPQNALLRIECMLYNFISRCTVFREHGDSFLIMATKASSLAAGYLS